MSHDPHDSKLTDWVRDHRAPGDPSFDTDAAWARFRRGHDVDVLSIRRRRRTIAWQIAAAIIVVAGLGYMYRGNRTSLTERVTANGERATIALDDGTRITLNGGSRLRYASASGDRDVYLEGEAFFEVKHDPSRELRVHVANGVVRDVGTKFNVRAYANQPGVQVAVTEGSVALSRQSSSTELTLAAGDVGMLGASGEPRKFSGGAEQYAGWTSGSLVFDNVSLRDAARELEHRYGVKVPVPDSSLAARPVVARFHGESISQILDAISVALGAHYTRKDSTYTLIPGAK